MERARSVLSGDRTDAGGRLGAMGVCGSARLRIWLLSRRRDRRMIAKLVQRQTRRMMLTTIGNPLPRPQCVLQAVLHPGRPC